MFSWFHPHRSQSLGYYASLIDLLFYVASLCPLPVFVIFPTLLWCTCAIHLFSLVFFLELCLLFVGTSVLASFVFRQAYTYPSTSYKSYCWVTCVNHRSGNTSTVFKSHKSFPPLICREIIESSRLCQWLWLCCRSCTGSAQVRSVWRRKGDLWRRTELNLRAALKHSK